MTKLVPYLSDETIERDAAALLADYAQARGIAIRPPIPIEDIVEKHLKLGIEFDDTHKLFSVPRSGSGLEPDILGAIFFDQARIVIDESLDPEENPGMEGRYRFTLAQRNAQRLFERQEPRQKRRLLNFVLSNCSWEDGEVVATFRQPFDLLAETTAIAARQAAGNTANSAKSEIWLGD